MGGMYGGKAGQKTFSGPGNILTPDQLQEKIAAMKRGEEIAPEIVGPLSEQERQSFADHEATIERGINTFKEVGDALMAIRDGREYREAYSSFEDYLLTRWNMRRNYANKLIDAAKVVENLKGTNGTLPANERQARELSRLTDPDQVLAWKTIVDTAPGGKPTAGHIEAVVEVLKEIRDTGTLDFGQETELSASEALQARLTEEAHERMQRQKAHIDESNKKKAHVANNTGEYEWYTPSPIIEAARRAMGSIDTDPATSEIANENVRAGTIYTLDNSGLDFNNKWRGNVWLNPPYARELIGDFTRRMVDQFNDNETIQAIVLVNNATETEWFQHLMRYASAICFPKGRVEFKRSDGSDGSGPLQGQAILYLGENVAAFAHEFKVFGKVLYAGE